MKKRIALLFVLIMVLTCVPVMASAPAGSPAAAESVTVQAAKSGWIKTGDYYRYYVNGQYYKNGIYEIGGELFGFNGSGYLQQGFFKINGRLYYGSKAFGPKGYGIVVTGYQKIGSDYYCFNPKNNGAAIRGFVSFGGNRYFFDPETCKQRRTKGWFYYGNAMYYVQADGTIAVNKTVDGYKIGATGAVTDVYGMDKKAQGYSSDTRYLILVNKKQHVINVYQGSKGSWVGVRRNMPCTIGKSSTPSPSGSWRLNHKSSRPYGYKDFNGSTVFYATRISAGNYFHSILYKKGSRNPATAKVKDGSLGKNKSNSCIRMRLEDAKYIHQVTPRNSRVIVY